MIRDRDEAYLRWLALAEEAAKRGDYEEAARFYRYVAVHFGLLNDSENLKKFTLKAGECCFNAAETLLNNNKHIEALLFLIKASNYFREGSDEHRAEKCDMIIERSYDSLSKNEMTDLCGDPQDLKRIGDYFANRDLEKAIECYEAAAEKAFKIGKLHLSGGIYGILGDCYKALKRYRDAAERHARSAEMYYERHKFFEAAWHYCISGFCFILAGDTEAALATALKAESICREDNINIILNDLAYICRLLSEGHIYKAERRWSRIRRKFKRSYAEIIDSSFDTMRLDR